MPTKPRVVCFFNQKGGTGKTTTCLAVAGHLAQRKRRVLVVDMDPQANATTGLGVDHVALDGTVHDLLALYCPGYEGGDDLPQVIVETKVANLSLLPADPDLSIMEVLLQQATDRTQILQFVLEEVAGGFDYILIDNPPHIGLLSLNGLMVADHVVVPLDPSLFAMGSLKNLAKYFQEMGEMTGHRFEKTSLVLNRYQDPSWLERVMKRPSAAMAIRKQLEGMVSDLILVPESPLAYQAQQKGMPVSILAPNSDISKAFLKIANSIDG